MAEHVRGQRKGSPVRRRASKPRGFEGKTAQQNSLKNGAKCVYYKKNQIGPQWPARKASAPRRFALSELYKTASLSIISRLSWESLAWSSFLFVPSAAKRTLALSAFANLSFPLIMSRTSALLPVLNDSASDCMLLSGPRESARGAGFVSKRGICSTLREAQRRRMRSYVFQLFSNCWETLRGLFSAVSTPNFATK